MDCYILGCDFTADNFYEFSQHQSTHFVHDAKTQAAIMQATAHSILFCSQFMDDERKLQFVDVVTLLTDGSLSMMDICDGCCPVCQEVTCDEDCPLWPIRAAFYHNYNRGIDEADPDTA